MRVAALSPDVRSALIHTPIGKMLACFEGGSLHLLVFADQPALEAIAAASPPRAGEGRDPSFAALECQLDEYFAGRRISFDIPIDARGTPFQLQAWAALRGIVYGDRVSYAELARAAGCAGKARPIGRALGANPILILQPCHRVLGSGGRLGGYVGGLDRKRFLLELESRGRL